jgi:hypothetical protein
MKIIGRFLYTKREELNKDCVNCEDQAGYIEKKSQSIIEFQ